MKTKLLLYCTKAKPYLYKTEDTTYPAYPIGYHTDKYLKVKLNNTNELANLNGKIVAECDYEVESINVLDCTFRTFNLTEKEILNKSCLTYKELFEYLKNRDNPRGYIIHIKNLHIFDEPRDIRNYYTNRVYTKIEDVYTDEIQIKSNEWCRPIKNAPQNMCYAFDNEGNKYIVISIQSQWMCLILNRIKDVEVRRVVLKEMLNNV